MHGVRQCESVGMNARKKMTLIIALGMASLAVITAAIYLSLPQPQPSGASLAFYSAESKPPVYAVFATLTNNSTLPIAVQGVFFDDSELIHSSQFLVTVGGIWSMRSDMDAENVLRAGGVGTLLVTSAEANSSVLHTIRVVTNTSTLDFCVELRASSLVFKNYTAFEGPGIDYLFVHIENVGTATGNIASVMIDGVDFEFVYNMRPPSSRYQWSVVVGGNPAPFIGIGQQAQIYVSMTELCHTCWHIMKVSCSDGSFAEFTFKLR
jgi:hypothetical protein